MFSAAILTGGQARRLGGLDKSALAVGADSILDRQLGVLRGLTPHILIVASQRPHAPVPGVTIVEDRIARAGALGGLYTALVEAPTEHVLVIACDMPFLTASFLSRLATCGGGGEDAADAGIDVVVPRDARGRHPLCALYHRRVAPALRAHILAGNLRVGDALAGLSVRELGPDELIPFDPDGRLLININTALDYSRAQRVARQDTSTG